MQESKSDQLVLQNPDIPGMLQCIREAAADIAGGYITSIIVVTNGRFHASEPAANLARELALTYGFNIAHSGPRFAEYTKQFPKPIHRIIT